jgi:transcription antitermination factor NusG
MSKWFIWVVRQGKIDSIKYFLETEVPAVEEVFFPTVLKEFRVGTKIRRRRVPLYSGYLFLKYTDTEDSRVFYTIRSNPFVTNFVGACSESKVEEMKKKEEWNVLSKEVGVGDRVEIMCGPFVKCKGTVNSINCTLPSEDLEIIGK